MQKVRSIAQLKKNLHQWRKQNLSIAFVPTMGNLHEGHIKLVLAARKKADKVVVSIFVNPTQFGVGEDFESYPRTEEDDEIKLKEACADLLFLPSVLEIYPEAMETIVSVTKLSTRHCGKSRPNHFNGVATIVVKLLNMVQPDIAFFGEKDFQQLAIIRKMVNDLNISCEIIGVETERELDGLAMSSRNNYLTESERKIAPKLYHSICKARENVLLGVKDLKVIEKEQYDYLASLGFVVDYFSICRCDNLQPAKVSDNEIVILVAAKLGKPRLIDNIYFSR
ncbi:MAG: pantoate--beta-alanine ligase [Methylococcaceae bacterium]|nr:pantoate--beta-alanine ligase [Methylococcaceae bacterium]